MWFPLVKPGVATRLGRQVLLPFLRAFVLEINGAGGDINWPHFCVNSGFEAVGSSPFPVPLFMLARRVN